MPPFNRQQAQNEIAARNALRRRYGLRALSIGQELRKAWLGAQERDFDRFIAENTELWGRVSAHVLERMRRELRDHTWLPTERRYGFEHRLRTERILHWIWRRSRKG